VVFRRAVYRWSGRLFVWDTGQPTAHQKAEQSATYKGFG
jgi:hypothetical protein